MRKDDAIQLVKAAAEHQISAEVAEGILDTLKEEGILKPTKTMTFTTIEGYSFVHTTDGWDD